MSDPFAGLPRNHFGVILADPPWHFETWSAKGDGRAPIYQTQSIEWLKSLPVRDLLGSNCVLFMWVNSPSLVQGLGLLTAWGFVYKTIAFTWAKDGPIGMGYWTRAGSEICLLATCGNPKRLHADVRQLIIEPRREHSRKPDCVHERIERLVAGPYLELFARQSRPGWTTWGNEATEFDKVSA